MASESSTPRPIWLQGDSDAAASVPPMDVPIQRTQSPDRLPSARSRPPRGGGRRTEIDQMPGGGGGRGLGGGRRGQTVEESWDSLSLFLGNHMGRIGGPGDPGSPTQPEVPTDSFESGAAADEGGAADEPAADEWPDLDESLVVPTLPTGRTIVLDILSTWGDVYYVGLTGIDIFDASGNLVQVDPEHISANPADINTLGGYSRDPRTVDKLVDRVNRTTDDLHMWLAPFTQGQHHTVTITFSTDVTISMIRVWNYNKSRIHSHRGARYVEIVLDGTQIFAGEFSKANGLTEGSEDSAEHILFTTDAGTVTAIEALLQDQKEQLNQDQDLQGLAEGVGGLDLDYSQMRSSADALRPDQELGRRAELSMPQSAGGGGGASSFAPSAAFEPGAAQLCDRPFTAAGGRPEFDASAAGPPNQGYETPNQPRGLTFTFQLLTTWGDRHYGGLTALELYDENGELITPMTHDFTYEATVESVNVLDEVSGDSRTLEKLFDGLSNTWRDSHMWLYPILRGHADQPNKLTLRFPKPVEVTMVKVWNYSKTATRGIKEFDMYIDNRLVYHGYLRRAPPKPPKGEPEPQFGQTILFTAKPEILAAEACNVYNFSSADEELTFIDNHCVIQGGSEMWGERPATSVAHFK